MHVCEIFPFGVCVVNCCGELVKANRNPFRWGGCRSLLCVRNRVCWKKLERSLLPPAIVFEERDAGAGPAGVERGGRAAKRAGVAMRAPRMLIAAMLTLSACGRPDDAGLRDELRHESATIGLALAQAIAGDIVVIPFDSPAKYFQAEFRFPISAFGKGGDTVVWWSPRNFWDFRGEFVVDSTSGKKVAEGHPPLSGFHPVALNESAGRLAFWCGPQGKTPGGLYWASFDFSNVGFVDEGKSYPDWSPDGGALVYAKEGRIYLFDVVSSSSRPLVAGHDPTWSTNGKWIAFIGPDGLASLVTTQGIPLNWPVSTRHPMSPLRWSPDGRYVSFSEALPPSFAVMYAVSRLVVCRVSDGKTITVQKLGSKSGDWGAFHWIVDYRKFCGRCTLKETPK